MAPAVPNAPPAAAPHSAPPAVACLVAAALARADSRGAAQLVAAALGAWLRGAISSGFARESTPWSKGPCTYDRARKAGPCCTVGECEIVVGPELQQLWAPGGTEDEALKLLGVGPAIANVADALAAVMRATWRVRRLRKAHVCTAAAFQSLSAAEAGRHPYAHARAHLHRESHTGRGTGPPHLHSRPPSSGQRSSLSRR